MSGNAAQRRRALRAKERLSKRSEGRYPWLESALAPPEPRGEAEGALAGQELMNWDLVHEVHTEGKQFEQVMPPKKRRTLWNWLRKLVGRWRNA